MTDDDVKLNKMDKKHGSTVGRPRKKVVKSPKKNAPDSGDVSNIDYCACKEYKDGELSLECDSCHKYWHLCCVGLKGMDMNMVALLANWKCPDCFTCPHSYLDRPSMPSSVNVMVRDELHAIQPMIKATVEDAVRNVIAPEPRKESSTEEKRKEDRQFCSHVLEIPLTDIEVCWRAGKVDESKPEYCRPLIIKLKDEELVKEWTKDGVPTLERGDGSRTSGPADSAEVLAGAFSSVFVHEPENLPDVEMPEGNCDILNDIDISFDKDLIDTITELNKKECENDPIPLKLLVKCLEEVKNILLFIVNDSLATGTFPKSLKEALVKPAIKDQNGDCNDYKNYRPISNLAFVSKIIEKTVHKQSSVNTWQNMTSMLKIRVGTGRITAVKQLL
ncbi:hypothetical protein ACHWQZ_G003909 [Mnemiopsis leidyi]